MEEIVEVIQLLYTDEEVDRQREEEIDYGDGEVDRRFERLPDGMQSGMHDRFGKNKGLRFRP